MIESNDENSGDNSIEGGSVPVGGDQPPSLPDTPPVDPVSESSGVKSEATEMAGPTSVKAKEKSDGDEEEVPNDVVLVVDDSQPNRKIVRAALEKHRIPVIESSDGKDAEFRFKMHQAKVMAIISDINMPGQDGVELLEAVRQLKGDLPFILITGEPFAERIKRARELKVSAIVVKPLTSQVLIEKLAQALPNKVRIR